MVRRDQSGRYYQEVRTEGLQSNIAKHRRQTSPLEPVDDIVSKKEQMEVELIGSEIVGRDLGQGKVFLELPDVLFYDRPTPIEIPDILWLHTKIGDEDLITVALQCEERELV